MRQVHKLLLATFFILFSFISNAQEAEETTPSLRQATLTNEQIIAWANQIAVAANTYDYNNYQQQFDTISHQYFTPDSWAIYMNSLQNSGNLRTVITKQLALTAVINGSSAIVQQGIMQGRYTWTIQVPILVTYSNIAGTINKQAFTVTMQIERSFSAPPGVSIKRFTMSK